MFGITRVEVPKEYTPSTTKGMFLKGIIHFTDDNNSFEVLQEEFFFNHLEKNGEFLSQSDFDIYLEHELPCLSWDMKPKAGQVYGVLYHFNLNHSRAWTDCGYEYDSEAEMVKLMFDMFDQEATKRILGDTDFQFDLPPVPTPPAPRIIQEDK